MFHDEYFRAVKKALDHRRQQWVEQLLSPQTSPERTTYLRGCVNALDDTLQAMRDLNARIERAEAA
jgi:hypothetical protein